MLSSYLLFLFINSLIKRVAEDDGNTRQVLDLMGYGGVSRCHIRQTPLNCSILPVMRTYFRARFKCLRHVTNIDRYSTIDIGSNGLVVCGNPRGENG
jgi:hypothetical protein